jgi:beta-glucosidase/6-phospho-beta-glucosidase/beta-galactosidase
MMSQKTEQRPSSSRLFPSFFLGGFECSTPLNFDRVRIDELVSTGHDAQVRADYRRLRNVGIRAARDGARWNLIDRDGRLEFSSVLPYIEAAQAEGITVIWDLFHYGYPEDLDPFADSFVERFGTYCAAFARLLVQRGYGEWPHDGRCERFYTPVNEISFFAWAGGEVGIFAPFAVGRAAELKRRLARAAIAGIDAIREVDPCARFVNCDPIVHVVAPADAPWLQEEADYFNAHYVCEAWDLLAGRLEPELGGSPAHLDIVGVNYYGVNQWEHQRHDSVLAEDDPRRVPFADLLCDLYDRYEHPILVAETSSCGADRSRWINSIVRQCQSAVARGTDLHGVCIYPVVGMTDWHTGEFRSMGLWDRAADGDRRVELSTLAVLRSWQRQIERRWPRPLPATRRPAYVEATVGLERIPR